MNHKGHTNGVGPKWAVKIWPQGPMVVPSKDHDEDYLHHYNKRDVADANFFFHSVRRIPAWCKRTGDSVSFWILVAIINHIALRTCGWWIYYRPDKIVKAYIGRLFNIRSD